MNNSFVFSKLRESHDKIFALTDANVREALDERLDWSSIDDVIVIPPGEKSKALDVATDIWYHLSQNGATRRSLLLNIGGGVVCDLGGFCAATFKRGIHFINIPTTLLAMADAAIGGKTGIDFFGLKNEIGTFAMPLDTIIDPSLLETLPDAELRSGFAEVVKCAILSDETLYNDLLRPDALYDKQLLARATRHAADFKRRIVEIDPKEQGIRRILNFGHTFGHAYESYAAEVGHPISHGCAVAHGMLRALELSRDRLGLDPRRVDEYRECILQRYYQPLPFGPEADEQIALLMAHDKKNLCEGEINYILIPEIGKFEQIE